GLSLVRFISPVLCRRYKTMMAVAAPDLDQSGTKAPPHEIADPLLLLGAAGVPEVDDVRRAEPAGTAVPLGPAAAAPLLFRQAHPPSEVSSPTRIASRCLSHFDSHPLDPLIYYSI